MARPLILVASDDPVTVASITRFLDLEGFDCASATSGPEAVTALATRDVAAAVLDLAQSEPDSLAIARLCEATSATGDLPLLLLAADVTPEAAAFEAGAAVVISKPFHLAAIAAQLHSLVPGADPPRD